MCAMHVKARSPTYTTHLSFVSTSSFSLLTSSTRFLTSLSTFSSCMVMSWFILLRWATWASVGGWVASTCVDGREGAEEECARTALGLEMRVWMVDTVSAYFALCKRKAMHVDVC